jgi:hypothetical protein
VDVVQVIVSILCPAGGQANPWELTRNRAAHVWGFFFSRKNDLKFKM